MPFCFIIRF
jgi:hypothetical protein